jgi:predicted branched-subunit amino acid permease
MRRSVLRGATIAVKPATHHANGSSSDDETPQLQRRAGQGGELPGAVMRTPALAPTSAPTFTFDGVVDGARKGILLAPTLVTFGFAVGVLAASKGLTVLEIGLMSAWVYAGGAQMATLQIWAEPLPLFALVLTMLAMNARYALLSASLRPHFGALPFWQIYPGLAMFGDGNWALTMRELHQRRRPDAGFLLGSGLVMFVPWVGASVAGHLFGQALGDPRRLGIDFMLAAFFATMAVGFFRVARSVAPLFVAIAVAIAVDRLVAGPWYLFAGALAGSLTGALRHVDPA